MNNIQKMENKVYKTYIEGLRNVDLMEGSSFFEYILTNQGRRGCIKGIREMAKFRVKYIDKISKYEALKTIRSAVSLYEKRE